MSLSRLLIAVLLAASASAAERDRPAGAHADLGRMRIVGAAQVPAESVRTGLQADPPVALAAHPRASLDALVAILAERAAIGYRHEGFPDATARAQVVGGVLELRIEEGPRFRCGDVVVEGGTLGPALAAWLTRPRHETAPVVTGDAPDTAIDWRRGEPAPFDDTARRWLRERVDAFYAAQPRIGQRWELVVRRGGDGVATLAIDVTSDGVAPTLGDVLVAGEEEDAAHAQAVRDLLALRPGEEVLSPRLLAETRRRLRDSARFQSATVAVQPGVDGAQDLLVTVLAAPRSPRLPEPLAPHQRALVAAAGWIEAWGRGGEDRELLVEIARKGLPAMRLVLAPRSRAMALELVAGDTRCALVLTDRSTVLTGPATRWQGPAAGNVEAFVALEPDARWRSGADGEGTTTMTMNLSAGTKDAGFTSDVRVAPASLVDMAAREGVTAELAGDELRITRQGRVLTLDARTGEPRSPLEAEHDGNAVRLEFVHGTAATLAAAPAGVADRGEALTFLGFMAAEQVVPLLRASGREREAAAVGDLAHAAEPELAALMDVMRAWRTAGQAGGFDVPVETPTDGLRALILWGARGAHARLAASLGAERWPAVVARETYRMAAGRSDQLAATLRDLHGDERIGPVGCLAIARLLAFIGQRGAAGAFADLGRERLADGWRHDVALLAPIAAPLARIIARLEHPDAVAALVAPGRAADVATLMRAAGAAQDPQALLADLAGMAWEDGLRDRVAAALAFLDAPGGQEM